MQIEFTRLKATDCFAYTLLDFQFKSGIHSVVGTNGASKTSIFLTLLQGLFNRNPKNIKIDDVSNNITREPYEIELWFLKGGVEHYIKNSKKTGKIEILIDGKPKHLKRIPDNLKLIEEIIGCDYSMAVDLMYQHIKSSINLLEVSSDGERKKFLNRILAFDDLDYHLKRLDEKAKELSGKHGRILQLETQVGVFESGIRELQEELEDQDTTALAEKISSEESARDQLLVKLTECRRSEQEAEAAHEEASRHATTGKRIAEIETKLANYTSDPLSLDELTAGVQALKDQMQELRLTLLKNQTAVSVAAAAQQKKQRLAEVREQLSQIELPEKDREFVVSNLEKLNALKVKTESYRAGHVAEHSKLTAATAAGTCPTCGHEVRPDQLAADLARLEDLIEGENLTLTKCAEAIPKYKAMQQVWDQLAALTAEKDRLEDTPGLDADLQKERSNLVETEMALKDLDVAHAALTLRREAETSREALVKKLADLKSQTGNFDLDAVKDGVERTYTARLLAEQTLNALDSSLRLHKEELSRRQEHNTNARVRRNLNQQTEENNRVIRLQLDATRKELQECEEKLKLLKSWLVILGPKGYRVNKMDKFLRQLNITMRSYAAMISGGRIQCRFFIDPEGEVDFEITDAHKTQPYANWSDGEKARVKMACLFAVLELLEVLGTVSFNVLALDEIFGALDDEGKEGLFKVLSHLQGKGKCIYTIAHSEIALDMVYDSTIKAIKNPDGTSTIKQ